MAPGKFTSIIFFVLVSYIALQGCGSGGGSVTITTPNITVSGGSEGTEGVVNILNDDAEIVLSTSTALP